MPISPTPMLKATELIHRLAENNVDFIVIGGIACILHGAQNVTQDLDVFTPMSEENLSKVLKAMEGLDPRFRMRPDRMRLYTEVERLRGFKNLYLLTQWGMLDMLGEVSGIGTFGEASRDAVIMDIEGTKTKILCIDDLIRAKTAAGRPKDRMAVNDLLAVKKRNERPLFE